MIGAAIETAAGLWHAKSMNSPLSLVFRPALPNDYAEVARITRDSYVQAGYFESADHPYMRRIQDVAARAGQAQMWVAEQWLKKRLELVGSVTMVRHGEPYADIAWPDELEMRMLVVDPCRQGAGIGTAMVRAVMVHARSLDGVRAVSLSTGDSWLSAHALYRSLGFRRQPERDWQVTREKLEGCPQVQGCDQPEDEEIWLRVYRREV